MFGRRFNYLSTYGLDEQEFNTLGIYNAEVGRGLVHTPAYTEKMSVLQARYNEARSLAHILRPTGQQGLVGRGGTMSAESFKYTDADDLQVDEKGPNTRLTKVEEIALGLEAALASLAERVATLEAWAQHHDPGPDTDTT